MITGRIFKAALALVIGVAATDAAHGDCPKAWTGFKDITGRVQALTVFNDGSGPKLVVSSGTASPTSILTLPDGTTTRTAIWDGSKWTKLTLAGQGSSDRITAFATAQSEQGETLYGWAWGSGVMRLNGTSWEKAVSVFGGSTLDKILIWNDGNGDAVFQVTFDRVYRAALPNGPIQSIGGLSPGFAGPPAVSTFDFGSGPQLVVGGYFTEIAGVDANGVARWDGRTWQPIGSGIGGTSSSFVVESLTTWIRDGNPTLVAAGQFNSAGGKPAASLAFWNGEEWEPAAGMTGSNNDIFAVLPADLGDGVSLYLSSYGTSINGVTGRIFRYDSPGILITLPGIQTSPFSNWPLAIWETPAGTQLVVGSPNSTSIFAGAGLNAKNLAAYGCFCPDLTNDGLVNDADLGLVLNGFSQSAAGDVDNDGDTDDVDLGYVLDRFGKACR